MGLARGGTPDSGRGADPAAGDAADLRRSIGERWDDPTGPAERSSLIEAAEEQGALIAELESRRAGLLRQPGPAVIDVLAVIPDGTCDSPEAVVIEIIAVDEE